MRRRRIMALGGLTIVLVAVFLLARRDDGPVYNGHTLYHWLDIAIKTNTPLAAPEDVLIAYQAVIHTGTNGIPWLLRQVRRSPNPWEYKLGARISNLGYPWNVRISSLVLGNASYESGLAVHGFELLGTNAVCALPELAKIANRTNSLGPSQSALISLWHLGPAAFPVLSSILTNAAHPHRGLAARLAVEVMPHPDDRTLAAITGLASDSDPAVARLAREALRYRSLQTNANSQPPDTTGSHSESPPSSPPR